MICRTLDNGSDHSDTEALKLFQETLKDTPPGELRPGDEDRIIGVLAKCWDQLSGATETSMRAYKLHRVERLEWSPPILSFTMERHGGTVFGSTRAELQKWTVNVETGIADHSPGARRQLEPTAKRLDVAPIAGRVYEAVDNGPTSQSQLVKEGTVTWQDERRLIIKHGALIPNEGFKQTVAGRPKRLRQELIRGLGERGWHLIRVVRWMTFERKSETD